MRTDVMARDYLRRAASRLLDANSALSRGDYPEVVRYSQECVELSLKACLRAVGVEYPKVHDVGDLLLVSLDRFPGWFKEVASKLAEISRSLAEKRSPAMYGLELLGKPPSELFGFDEAKEAYEEAVFTHNVAKRFIEEFFGQ